MNLRKLIAVILVAVALIFISKAPTYAVTKTSGDLRITYSDPLFSPSIIWYPGLEQVGSVKVENISLNSHDVLMQATNTSQTGNIADQFQIKIVQDGTTLWGKDTLKHFWDLGQHEYGFIPNGQWKTYDFYISLPASTGNEFQNKTAGFDVIIGFKGQIGTETVTVLGTSTGGGTTTSGGGATTTVFGNNPEVLGATEGTQSAVSTPSGNKGAYEERVLGSTSCKSCFWWPILLVEGLILVVYLLVLKKTSWLFPLVVSFTSYLVFLWFNRTCTDWTSISCKLFWLWDLLILLAWSLAQRFYPGK